MGRLRLRWLKDVVSDLRELKVKRWRGRDNKRYGRASAIKVAMSVQDRRTKEYVSDFNAIPHLITQSKRNWYRPKFLRVMFKGID
jgi:hypothetical protein